MLVGILAIVILTLVSLVVLVQGPRKKTNVSLAVTIVSINTWILSIYGLESQLGASVEYARAVFGIGMISLSSLLWFVDSFITEGGNAKSLRAYPITPFYVIAAIVTTLTMFTDYVIDDLVTQSGILPVPIYGELFVAYLLVLVGSIAAMTQMLVVGVTKTRGTARSRNSIVAITIVTSVLVGLTTNLIVPIVRQDSQFALLAPLTAMVLSLGLLYAIVKHGLFDIRLAAVRTLAYVFSLLTLAGIYFGMAFLVSSTLFEGGTEESVTVNSLNIVLALALAFLFQPIKKFFDRTTDRIFFRNRYNTSDFIASFGALLASSSDLRPLLEAAGNKIAQTLKSSEVVFVIHREDKPDEVVGTSPKSIVANADLAILKTIFSNLGDVKVLHDAIDDEHYTAEQRRAIRYLLKHHYSLVMPLGETTGYALLGEQKGTGYKHRDVTALEAVRDELFIAIQNARSLEEVRKFNKTLQQRISTATKELRTSNAELRKLDETKDEFISMASHQLRTPLTSIKGYISMLLDGDAGQLNDQQRKLLGEAFVSSERMVRLIGDFLNVSRLQTGKFIIDPMPVDLVSMVDEEVEAIKRMADQHQVKLSFKPPKTFPTLMIDENKTRQVIMNFIDNAVYYSRQKSTIVVKLHKDERSVFFEVHDHGIGVPKELQGQLFSKFFRAENARRKRPDGTGVGLYLAKKVIDAQGGEVIFSSTEGKGSMFGFRLPIKQPTAKQ